MKHVCRTRSLIVALALSPIGLARAAGTAAPAAAASGAKAAAPAAAAPAAHSTPEAPSAGNRSGTPENPTPTARPANQLGNGATVNGQNQVNRDNVNRERSNNGNGYLIPGYYGTNYWDNGYLNNQTQYYGQFQQNDYNSNNQQQSQQQNGDTQAPALYIPPGQAETPSMTAAEKASPAYQQADVELRAAQAEYDAASQRVTDRLHQDPNYQQATEKKDADASKLSTMKDKKPAPSPEQAAPIAQAKLNAAKSVTDMERQAIMNDPQASAAKAKLDAAIAKRAAIQAQIEGSLPKAAPAAR